VDKVLSSFDKLKSYIEKEQFKGWDPYDGLNSRIFQALPFKHWDLARLAWIQFFKRSPFNFRKLLMVPKAYNAKGLGLLLTAYSNLHQIKTTHPGALPYTLEALEKQIHFLAKQLIDLKVTGYSGSCWGYNFDWQARRLFLFPRNTPNVVTTYFAFYGLLKAYEVTREKDYLETALGAAKFVLNDLNRTPTADGFLFSYSPLNGNNTVYNASLLGSKLLSHCYHYTQNETFKEAARASVQACLTAQNKDGAWPYGALPVQQWIDSFHTGYNLDALMAYREYCHDTSVDSSIQSGLDFYLRSFFSDEGNPSYYHNQRYPIDIHCPAQLFVSLSRTQAFKKNQLLATKVMDWTLKHMQHKKGYFFYQLKKGVSSKIPYMRWSNAFMMYAMSYYLKESLK
jgi:rhamnogalacturonyl hydrolase YesR